jgi:hydrogenase small subunit
MPSEAAVKAEETLIHVLWINAGLSCDGDSVALTAATQPSIEEIALGALPGLPKIAVHWPLIDFECGPTGGADDFLEWFFKAERGELEPFVLVVEGSIPNEQIKDEGYWCGFGNNPETGQPMTTSEWLDRLTPKATAVVAMGTCAAYGGIHAMAGNPTGAMGVPDYLGWDWKSKAGIPIVCVPGCPAHPDNMAETLTYLLYMATNQAPMIPLDDALRPKWLFGATVHEGCDRAGYYEQGDFATEYGSPKCIVKLGCWGPVVKCNVPKRGWVNGIGGCPNVGGICQASRTSSCRSWTNRRVARFPRRRRVCTARSSATSATSQVARWTKNRSGGIPARDSRPERFAPGKCGPSPGCCTCVPSPKSPAALLTRRKRTVR